MKLREIDDSGYLLGGAGRAGDEDISQLHINAQEAGSRQSLSHNVDRHFGQRLCEKVEYDGYGQELVQAFGMPVLRL